jgi:hypothetical protein
MAISARDTARELDERFGGLYDLGALARFCGVSSRTLRRSLEEAGVPVLTVGRKHAVVRQLAERALGLDRAEVGLEIQRNEAAMRGLERRPDGTLKPVGEYAAESSARARAALEAFGARRTR